MSKSAALGIIFLVEFSLGLWQFKPHGPTSTHLISSLLLSTSDSFLVLHSHLTTSQSIYCKIDLLFTPKLLEDLM